MQLESIGRAFALPQTEVSKPWVKVEQKGEQLLCAFKILHSHSNGQAASIGVRALNVFTTRHLFFRAGKNQGSFYPANH